MNKESTPSGIPKIIDDVFEAMPENGEELILSAAMFLLGVSEDNGGKSEKRNQ